MEIVVEGHVHPAAEKVAVGVIQPYRWPSISAKTRPKRPAVMRNVPAMSKPLGPPSSLVSGTVSQTPTSTMMPIGTLMRKAQCQEALVVSQPPTSGPRAAMPPIVPPQTAKAIARSLPTNTALMTESELGRIMAPPMP